MLESMTGFSEKTVFTSWGSFSIHLSSLNHRHLEIHFNIPPSMEEGRLLFKKIIEKEIHRGLVFLSIKEKGIPPLSMKINYPLLKKYIAEFSQLKEITEIEKPLSLEFLLQLPGVLSWEEENKENVLKEIKEALKETVKELKETRIKEGQELEKDIRKRVGTLREKIREIEKATKEKERRYKKSISEDTKELMDVSEELTRMKVHIKTMTKELNRSHSSGVKLDFLAQELLREANSLSSKIQDAEITLKVVDIKSELFKIREQLRNVA